MDLAEPTMIGSAGHLTIYPLLAFGGLLLIVAGVCDIVARMVPNWISLALISCGVLVRGLTGQLATGLLAAALVLVLTTICWRRGWLGGGDVKLLAAAATVVPPWLVPMLIVAVALAGGVLALIYLGLRPLTPAPGDPAPGSWLRRILRIEQWRIRRGGPLPYATAIGAGTIFTLFAS